MPDKLFVEIKSVLIDLASCEIMTVQIAQDESGNDNPNLGFDLVIQTKSSSTPTLFRYATRDEAVAQKNELVQLLRSRGCDVPRF